jgi:hypothetical protein
MKTVVGSKSTFSHGFARDFGIKYEKDMHFRYLIFFDNVVKRK